MALSNTAFWDTDMEQMDEKIHAPFIITRVFQYGLLNDIKEIIKAYSPTEIKHAFLSQRGIDKKGIALAAVLLKIDEKELE